LLLGLEGTVFGKLSKILSQQKHSVLSRPFRPTPRSLEVSLRLVVNSGAEVVCCSADPQQLASLIEAMHQRQLRVPVVVVSADPNTSEWLDAIESGAWDYLGTPFESTHIQHVLENASKCSNRTELN
jgi:DNA-binding NtrC family response regulator